MPVSSSYQNHTDELLLPEIADGATAAFNELYSRYGQKMFSYFFRMLWKDKELAEDHTQELFLKIIKHARDFEATKSLSTWIYSIAHNMCKNEYRKKETRMKHASIKNNEQAESKEKSIDLQKFRVAITRCVSQLSEEKKSLFILRFQEHLSVPEISRILAVPEGTIKSRIFYLLKDMTEDLKEFKTIHLYP